MADMNRVCLAGRLTRAVELRYTPAGKAVASLDLAINYRRLVAGGEAKDEVTFVECEVWGSQAEACSKYLGKGHGVLIEGHLKLDRWDKDGEPRSKLKVVAKRVHFLGAPRAKTSPPSGEALPEGHAQPRTAKVEDGGEGSPRSRKESSADVGSSEIPF